MTPALITAIALVLLCVVIVGGVCLAYHPDRHRIRRFFRYWYDRVWCWYHLNYRSTYDDSKQRPEK